MSETTDRQSSLKGAMKPRNVSQIVEAAEQYEYNAQIPVRYWLRSAAALLKEADIYMREGDDEATYLLLFRYVHLVLVHLETHPDGRDNSIKPLLSKARQEADRNLKMLAILKPRVNQNYERYMSISKEREERRSAQSKSPTGSLAGDDTHRQAVKRKIQHLQGSENSDLAVRLAQQEFQRRAAVRDGDSSTQRRHITDGNELSRNLQTIRIQIEQGMPRDNKVLPAVDKSPSAGFNYPNIRTQQREIGVSDIGHQPEPFPVAVKSLPYPPTLPPKPRTSSSSGAPTKPDKVADVYETRSTPHFKTVSDTAYTFTPTAFLEDGKPLRTLFLPPTLRTTFLRIAYQKTKANLETCGFLAGTLISNALFVSKLIIPAQISTSDTCEMTNESQLFDYVDSGADLMILGWIHTHPTQTCFMSSRDLHTHAGYQMMLPESIAVVCAPSKGDTAHGGDWGVYRLTDPPGKMAILKCNKPGVFHPHDVDHIYTDALRPGHVVEAKGLEFEVVDLRDG